MSQTALITQSDIAYDDDTQEFDMWCKTFFPRSIAKRLIEMMEGKVFAQCDLTLTMGHTKTFFTVSIGKHSGQAIVPIGEPNILPNAEDM